MKHSRVAAGVVAVVAGIAGTAFVGTGASAASSKNPCGSWGWMNISPVGMDYGSVWDDDSTCGTVAIQVKGTSSSSGIYIYAFRQKVDPVAGVRYSTSYVNANLFTFRGCSYDNTGNYWLFCEVADIRLGGFSGWVTANPAVF